MNNLILSIESAGSTCGVALSSDEGLIAEYSIFAAHQHDRMLAELCRKILAENSRTIGDIEAVAVSAGPGSFTGLRIGASIAKGLTFGNAPKLIPVPSLSALAAASDEYAQSLGATRILALIPSHRDLVYMQLFDEKANPLGEISLTEIPAIAQTISPDMVLCGPGAVLFPQGKTLSGLQRFTPRFIARLARRLFMEGQFSDSGEFVPLYVQEFVPKTGK